MICEQNMERECAICYDTLGTTNTCTTPCGHEFCFKCMMSALNHNNSCPCCRSTLKEEIVEEEDSDDEEENEWNPLDENVNYWREGTTFHNISNDDQIATPKIIAKKIEEAGYTMEDLVTIWLERIDRSSERYNDNNFVKKMVSDIENLVDNEDNEMETRVDEMELMGKEDHRTSQLESNDVFERFPDLDLNVLFNNM